MSQFRVEDGVSPAFWVSEWNGDSLNPGTADEPFAHIIDTTSTALILVGAGVYKGSIGTGTRDLRGDGKVIVDLMDNNVGVTVTFDKLHVKNVGTTNVLHGTDSIFENGSISMRGGKVRCVILGDASLHNGFSSSTFNCIFAQDAVSPDPSFTTGGVKQLNFISKSAKFRLRTSDFTDFQNNMLNGLLQCFEEDLVWREAKFLFDGSPRPDADPLIADIADVFPDFYTQGNFAGDPKFIDILSRTVEPDSDLLKAQNQYGYIGGVKPGSIVRFDNGNFEVILTNIDTTNPDLLRIQDGQTYGTIRMVGKVSDTLISSQKVDVRIPFQFDSSVAGGNDGNNNVPDAFHGLLGAGTKGQKPNRLTFEVRSSQKADADKAVDSDWDNDITGVPGRYYLMEWGQPLMHHIIGSVAYGNADANAINASTKTPFNYRSLDIVITLSNDRDQV